ncbi:hypothetical protein AVEN_44269-1 [Araneus ventricosus]|uniref:Uncharacterized protein n=1 Tax=Araneus ventricosus TaxID=182803 RepID=A0A4Y2W485_ARAVE|nr:hypothetical protein AVEN_44269-1 [Araneus ventricosus]
MEIFWNGKKKTYRRKPGKFGANDSKWWNSKELKQASYVPKMEILEREKNLSSKVERKPVRIWANDSKWWNSKELKSRLFISVPKWKFSGAGKKNLLVKVTKTVKFGA